MAREVQFDPPGHVRKTDRTRTIAIVVVVIALSLVLWQCIAQLVSIGGDYKADPDFAKAMIVIRDDARVVALLGEPIEEDGLYTYHYFSGSGGRRMDFGINLKGPKATGTARVVVDNGTVTSAVLSDAKGRLTNLLVKD